MSPWGKIEVTGKPPRRFALAPRGAESPLATLRQAHRDQGWRPGRAVTVLSDGEAALPGLVRAAVGEPTPCILDWRHISMRVQHIEQASGASMPLTLGTEQDWKWSSGGLDAFAI
jgi:hypothetical protein